MDKANKTYLKTTNEWLRERKLGIKDSMHGAVAYRKAAGIALEMAASSEKQAGLQRTLANIEIVEFNQWRKQFGLKPIKLLEKTKK